MRFKNIAILFLLAFASSLSAQTINFQKAKGKTNAQIILNGYTINGFSNDTDLADSSNLHLVTEAAAKAYIDAAVATGEIILLSAAPSGNASYKIAIDTVGADSLYINNAWPSAADWMLLATGGGGVTDGDKGHITVTGGGSTWNIDDGVVTTVKIADDAVTLAKMATGTANKNISYDVSGNPTATSKKYQNKDLYEDAIMIGSVGKKVKYNITDQALNVFSYLNDTMLLRSRIQKSAGDDFWKLFEIGTVSPQYLVNLDSISGTHTPFGTTSWASTGAEIHHDFHGTGFTFQHYGDNRGGIWRFYLEQNGTVVDSADIDTYHPTVIPEAERVDTVFSGLALAQYHIRAVNIPLWNPSSTGENRGWFSHYSTGNVIYERYYTFNIFSSFDDPINHWQTAENFLNGSSNKEFAFSLTPEGGSTSEWIPSHGFFSAKYTGDSLTILADGTEKTLAADTKPQLFFTAEKITVHQQFDCFHPDQANRVASVISTHSFSANKADFQIDLTWQDTATVSGYGFMLPIHEPFGDTLLTDQGQRMELDTEDNSEPTITEAHGNVKSFLVEKNNSDMILAARINDDNTLREQDGYVGTDFLQHRSTSDIQKVYMSAYSASNVLPGEKFKNSASIFFSAKNQKKRIEKLSDYVNDLAIDTNYAKINGNNGQLTIGTNDANALNLETNNVTYATLSSGGGFALTNSRLSVNGSGAMDATAAAQITLSNTSASQFAKMQVDDSGDFNISTVSAQTQLKVKNTGGTEITGYFMCTPMTATAASAITPANGMMVYVSDTNGTFTSVGFWGYENGAWTKL